MQNEIPASILVFRATTVEVLGIKRTNVPLELEIAQSRFRMQESITEEMKSRMIEEMKEKMKEGMIEGVIKEKEGTIDQVLLILTTQEMKHGTLAIQSVKFKVNSYWTIAVLLITPSVGGYELSRSERDNGG